MLTSRNILQAMNYFGQASE